MGILDDLEAGYQAGLGGVTPSSPIAIDALEANFQQSQSGLSQVDAIAGQLGKGAGFGWFDEFGAHESALRNSIANAFGAGSGKSYGETLEDVLARDRAQDAAFEAESPYLSTGLQVLGALGTGIGGGALVNGATGGIKALKAPIRLVTGAGMQGAPTVKQLIGMGAAGGAIAGAGEAAEGERLAGALLGGGTGAVAAPILGKGIEKGSEALLNAASRSGLLDALQGNGSLASQRGSFSWRPVAEGSGGPKYTAEELFLAKQLKDTPIEQVIAAADELDSTVSKDIPLFLPEAVNSGKVDRNAKFIANQAAAIDFARRAIDERTAGAAARGLETLGAVSPVDSSFEGAQQLIGAADEILKGADEARQKAVSPLYKEAYKANPTIESPALFTLIEKDKVLASAIREVKKTANNADLPDNSTELLVKARHEIGNQIEKAKEQGLGRKARDITDTYKRLNSILHKESTGLAKADATYGKLSEDVTDLSESFLTNLSRLSADKVKNVGQIFTLPAERISQLRQTFEQAGKLDEWNAGIRAHLQNAIEGTEEGRNFTRSLIGNTVQKRKLEAALGDSSEGVIEALRYEDRMFDGKNKYAPGSSTAGHLEEKQDFTKGVTGIFNKLKNGQYADAITQALSSDLPDEVAQAMARIYFDPKRGKDGLRKVIPLLEKYAKNAKAGDALGKATGMGVTRTTPSDLQGDGLSAQRSLGAEVGPKGRPQASQSKQSTQSGSSKNPTSDPDAILQAIERAEAKMTEGNKTEPVTILNKDKTAGLDSLVKAVTYVESRGNPKAVSPKGATGLMQIMPETAKEIAKKLGIKEYDLKDPDTNKLFGTFYLQEQLKAFGSKELALAAYNAGPGKVRQWKKMYGPTWEDISKGIEKDIRAGRKSPLYFKETRDYVKKVTKRLPKDTVQV